MKQRPPDDIAALCSHVEVDPNRYRVFARETPKPKTLVSETEDLSEYREPARPELHAISQKEHAARRVPELRALRNVLRNPGKATRAESEVGNRDRLAERVVSVFSAAGGVGGTTVAATLARIFARQGEQTLIVDGRTDSVVPYYFGSRNPSHAGRGLAALHEACDTPVHILTRQVWDAGHAQTEDANQEWLRHSLARSAETLDRMILDIWPNLSTGLFDEFCAAGTCLVVAVPDLSSVLGAKKIVKFLAARGLASSPVYVLNKFDNSQPLHVEIRDWFTRQFQQSRVAILRRTDDVTEALADGLTVIDSSKQSAIAEDYLNLAKAIRVGVEQDSRLELY